MSFEEEFDIEIPDDQVEKIKTVGDIVKFIEEKVEDWFTSSFSTSAVFVRRRYGLFFFLS